MLTCDSQTMLQTAVDNALLSNPYSALTYAILTPEQFITVVEARCDPYWLVATAVTATTADGASSSGDPSGLYSEVPDSNYGSRTDLPNRLQTCIPEVLGSSLGRDTDYSD
jgi:hypothetical protein